MIGTMKFFAYYNRYLTVVVSAVLYCSHVTKGQIIAERPVQDAAVPGEQPPATVPVRFDDQNYRMAQECDVSIFNENTDIQIYNEDSSNDDRLDNALGAANTATSLIVQLRGGLNTPADVINFVGNMADLVSVFVPQMAIFSAAFSLFGALTGTEEDAMTTALQEIRDEINELNARFDELKTVIELESCKQSIDDTFVDSIMPIRTAVDGIREGNTADKKAGYKSLEAHCSPTSVVRPSVALGHIKNYVLSEEGSFRYCHTRFVDDADNRILYYRRTFVLPLMAQIQEVIEYEGICQGVNNNVSVRTQSNLQRNIEKMKKEFEDKEAMMPAKWISSFLTKNQDTANTTADVLADLIENWSPSYKYKVFLVTGQDDRWECVGCQTTSGPKDGSGAVYLQRENGWLVVMWVGSDANPGDSVTWRNYNCNGSMCNREQSEWYCCSRPFPWIICARHCTKYNCNALNCGSTQQTADQNLSVNNNALHKDMRNRGAIFVHTGRRTWECIDCGGGPEIPETCIKEEEVLYDMNEEDYTICGDYNNQRNDVSIQNGYCCEYGYDIFNRVHDMVGDANVQQLRFREGEDFDYTVYVNRS